jgi:hypothetical protein
LKKQFSNTRGFLDVKQYDLSIPIHLRKIIESDGRIKPLLSDIENLISKHN